MQRGEPKGDLAEESGVSSTLGCSGPVGSQKCPQTHRAKDSRRIFGLGDGLVYRQIMPSAPMQSRWERFKLWLARRISNRKY